MEDIAGGPAAHGTRTAPPEMSREEATGRARTMKRVLSWAAVLTFILLWQAAARHLTGVTSRTGATAQTPTQPSGTSGGAGPSQSSGQGFDFGSSQSVQPFTQSTVS